MTSETRTMIELGDISGVEMECPECHLTIIFPVSKLFKIGPGCPHCNRKWFDEYISNTGEGRFPAIDAIQQIAAQLRAITRPDRTDIHAKIRLRVDTELKAAS